MLTGGFIEFIRSTPVLIQIFFMFYVFPQFGVVIPAFAAGVLALGIHYAAYCSEVYRAGLEAMPRGQWEAAIALNLSPWRTYKDVIIPQAIPPVVPALGNYLIGMFKETPLLSAIAVVELMQTAKIIGSETFRYLEPITMVGVFFLVMSLVSWPACASTEAGSSRAWLRNRQSQASRWSASRASSSATARSTVLDELDLDIAPNERVAIIGPSGSGKTTVLRMLMTLERIDGGVIEVDGEPLTHMQANGGLVPANERAPAPGARQDRHGLPALQPVPAHERLAELHRGAGPRAGPRQGRGRARAARAARHGGPRRQGGPLPRRSSRAASSSASRSRARSPCGPR